MSGLSPLKKWVLEKSPPLICSAIASSYWILNPSKKSKLMYPENGCWIVRSRKEKYYTFRSSPNRGSSKKRNYKYQKYNHNGFCAVKQGDIVVDIGAFLGEFSIPASQIASKVIAIEPDPSTYKCLSKQTIDKHNIIELNELPAEESTEIIFNTAQDPSESGILTPDAGEYEGIALKSKSVDEILSDIGIGHINYLKMDAEGAEPEVLRGIDDINVDRYAIDVGRERNGNGTKEEVSQILRNRDYDIKVVNREQYAPVLFAKRNDLS